MAAELMHIKVDSAQLDAALRNLEQAGRDLTPAMTDIAATLWERVGERFETHTDPVGTPWKEKKSGAPSVLYDSGHMLDSLFRFSDATQAMVGFGQPYATYHEYGTKKMVRRGLLFADPEAHTLAPADEESLLDAVQKHLSDALEG